MELLEQEKFELDVQPHACKRLGLAEISKRLAVRVRADMKAALLEKLVMDIMYSQNVL